MNEQITNDVYQLRITKSMKARDLKASVNICCGLRRGEKLGNKQSNVGYSSV